MKNISCDICGADIWSEERMSVALKDFSIEREFNIRLDEVCEDCISDVAIVVLKYVNSKLGEKDKNRGK